MRVIFESIFDVVYLIGVITLGVIMIKSSGGNPTRKLFGYMAVVLGAGDAFHLVPRIYSLITDSFAENIVPLGIGKLITSVTMTFFYMMLYYVWRNRYNITGERRTTGILWALAAVRVILCLFPQNMWTAPVQPMFWGILRNIPFTIMGIIIIALFYREIKKHNDTVFRFMPLAIILSFGFYIPVVLWGDIYPTIGLLMIPKTMAYVWIVFMGYKLPLND